MVKGENRTPTSPPLTYMYSRARARERARARTHTYTDFLKKTHTKKEITYFIA